MAACVRKAPLFDLVVFEEHRPTRIIEIKKRRSAAKSYRSDLKAQIKAQVENYRGFCIPVDLVGGMHNARLYIERIKTRGFLPDGEYCW